MLKIFILLSFVLPISARAELQRLVKVDKGVYRADQPDTLMDYEILQELHVKTIINLRDEPDNILNEQEVATNMGFLFHSFPMNALKYPDEAQVNKILAELSNPELQPVFIHCKAGKDRTGLIMALYRIQKQGWTRQQAAREMLDLGFTPALYPLTKYFIDHTKND
jgi:protein tyrosine/serine phosphatase